MRSDKTISATTLAENNRHENLHFFISQAPEAYTKLKETIFKQLTPKSKSIIEDRYGEAYFEVYNGNIERVYEEIVVDLSIGREQGQFVNVDIVNDAIKEFYASYSDIAKTETIKPYKKIKNTDTKYTVAHDSEGNPLTAKQNDYFKDSKVRDENGNLLVVYHGANEDFSVFDKRKINSGAGSTWGAGFYFTPQRDFARDYGQTKSYYLNITNPFNILGEGSYKKVFDLLDKHNIKIKKDVLKNKYDNAVAGIEEDMDLVDIVYDVWNNGRQPMSTISSILQSEGYDGIQAGSEMIAFEPNQIKSIYNINPTIDDDIRYVINKNKDIKDLVVVHNLSERKLLEAIDLGGLAVPSIAITKDSVGHENFGEISLIFKSDTINPADYRNKVFESDVYSKRFPKVVHKITEKSLKEFANRFRESANVFNDSVSGYAEELNENTKEYGFNTIEHKYWTKLQFLKENGVDI